MGSSKIQILLADDDTDLRETLVAHLAEQGYEVITASDGNEAIPLIYGREFNLVILDLRMPYIDGFAVLQFIKTTFPSTKVIVFTAYADLYNVMRCKELGADEVVTKPYELQELFNSIRALTEK